MIMITDIKHVHLEHNHVINVDVIKYGLPIDNNTFIIDRSMTFLQISDFLWNYILNSTSFTIITHIIINSPKYALGYILINKIIVSKFEILRGTHVYPCLLLPCSLGMNKFYLYVNAWIEDLTIRGSFNNVTMFTDDISVKPTYFSPCIVYSSQQSIQNAIPYLIEDINPLELLSKKNKWYDSKCSNCIAVKFFLSNTHIGYDVVPRLIDDAKKCGILNIIVGIERCALKMGLLLVRDVLGYIISYLVDCI